MKHYKISSSKIKFLAMLIVIVCSLSTSIYAAKDKHLFILSGQSNMAGLNPEISFHPTLKRKFGKKNIIVVKDAHGGRPISRWYKKWKPAKGSAPKNNGDLYEKLMDQVNPAIKNQTFASVTFIWMQGESDCNATKASVYEKSLKGLIKQLKKDLKIKEMNIVVGRISDHGLDKNNSKAWEIVREAQVKVAENSPHGAWVDTDDLNDKKQNNATMNDLHYTKDGYEILGKRFAKKAIELIKKR